MEILDLFLNRYPELLTQKDNIEKAFNIMCDSFDNKGKLLIAGNGGSAADAEHIVGELMKGFENPRKIDRDFVSELNKYGEEYGTILGKNLQCALPAIALDGHMALSTAYMNDCEPLLCFAQQVNGYGKKNDVFWAISTSGNSKNIIYATVVAKAKGMKVIGMTGAYDSKLSELADRVKEDRGGTL